MKKLSLPEVTEYVKNHIADFHKKRVDCLSTLKLKKVLKRKNPYLFKAKNLLTAEAIVRALLEAYLSSQEETLFGDWLEGLAIYINQKTYGGVKSSATGIDLEFTKDRRRCIVSIKSGPNWGNSSQIAKLKKDVVDAKKRIRTSGSKINVDAYNGCCYGNEYREFDEYTKICGQKFWCLISGDNDLYTKLIQPIGYQSHQKDKEFIEQYSKVVNKFTAEFGRDFCKKDGSIDWNKLVQYNSKEAVT